MRKDRHGLDFRFVHKNGDGKVLFDSGWLPNHMTDDGFELLYDEFFRGADAPDGFEIGLSQHSLSQTTSLGDIDGAGEPEEVTGTNYSRQTVERSNVGFTALELDNNDMQITSKTVQFENTGSAAWDSAVDAFLTAEGTAITDALVCYRPLSDTRTLQENDTLDVTVKIKGEQPA